MKFINCEINYKYMKKKLQGKQAHIKEIINKKAK